MTTVFAGGDTLDLEDRTVMRIDGLTGSVAFFTSLNLKTMAGGVGRK